MPPPSPTVLVVDDDLGLLRLIQRTLERESFSVVTAESGQEGIAWLGRNSANLLLLDLKLRDIEGRELINHLASVGRSLPFIIITGQGDERVAVEMMKRGALDYLVKDVKFIEFVPTVVRRALERLDKDKKLAEAQEARQQAEQSAYASGQQFRALVTATSDAVYRMSADWTQMLLLRGQEFIAVTDGASQGWPDKYIFPEDQARVMAAISEAIRTKSLFELEHRVRRVDGSAGWTFSRAVPILDATGEITDWFGMASDITERKKLEQSLIDASEREQRKFGHELHDGLGQRLTSLEMLSHVLAEDLSAHAEHLAKQARRLNSELRETVTEARLISHSLAPVPLDGDGLMRGLSELASRTCRHKGVKCSFLCEPPVLVHDPTVATHLYRIAQEAVTNALKHGKAKKIEIRLTKEAGVLELCVDNNGQPLPAGNQIRSGVGLNAMRYRAGIIGGNLAIEPGRRKGVKVSCTLRRKT